MANADAGFTDALTWVVEHSRGPQIAAGLEGARSYGIGLARVLAAEGCKSSRSISPAGPTAAGEASPIRSTRT